MTGEHMTSPQREWRIGDNHLWYEPPDILWHKVAGLLSIEVAISIVEIYRELASQRPFFSVADMSAPNTFEEESRRYFSEKIEPEWFAGVIYIRARLLHKAAAKGISLVHRLTGKDVVEPHFVSTEAEARDLIARLREQGTASRDA